MAVKHIRFTMASPVVKRDMIHFDALFGAVLTDGLPMADAEFSRLMPIEKQDGVYRCSAAFWPGVAGQAGDVAFQMSMQKTSDIEWIALQPDFGDVSLEKYRNKLNAYQAVWIDEIDFLAEVPDERLDEFTKILGKICNIGKKSRQGWGEVRRIAMMDHEGDPWLLPGPESIVSRALPMSMVKGSYLSNAAYRPDYQSYAPPYHSSPRTVCAVPPLGVDLDYDFDGEEIDQW